MLCYMLVPQGTENAVLLANKQLWCALGNCPDALVEQGKQLVESWHILHEYIFDCSADNDGGIDDHRSSSRFTEIAFESLICDGEKFIGVMISNKDGAALYFDGPQTYHEQECEYTPGWGDITEDWNYLLLKK